MSDPNPWVAPDAPAEAPRPGPVATALPSQTGARRPPPPPGLPVPLRPLTVGDVLDGALRILKLAPRTVLLLAAAFVVPVQLVVALVLPDLVGADQSGFGDLFGSGVGVGLSADLVALSIVLEGLSLMLVCAGLTHLVGAWYAGEDRSLADVFRFVGTRVGPIVLAWLLVHLAELGFAVLLLVPALVPMAWFLVAAPVVAGEGLGAWKALGRSRRLTSRRFLPVLGTGVLVAIVDALLGLALGAVADVYFALDLPYGLVVRTALAIATQLVTVPFVAGAAVLVHLDLRVRTEGLDIALAVPRRFAS